LVELRHSFMPIDASPWPDEFTKYGEMDGLFTNNNREIIYFAVGSEGVVNPTHSWRLSPFGRTLFVVS